MYEYGGFRVHNINDLDINDLDINDLDINDLDKLNIPNISIVLAWGMKINKKKSRDIIHKLFLSHKLLCFVQLKNGSPSLPTRLNHKTTIKPYIL